VLAPVTNAVTDLAGDVVGTASATLPAVPEEVLNSELNTRA
jgi:hypothetical protein